MDQEGGIRSSKSGKRLENLGITRRLKGSQVQGEHTGTGLAEAHVRLTKLSSMKLKASAQKTGLYVDDEDIIFESCMAQNISLSYGGVAPVMAAMGQQPRSFFELEDDSIAGIGGAAESSPDIFETTVRLRMMSLAAVQRSLVEDRFARANATHTQVLDISTIHAGVDPVGIFRLPEDGRESGWRGPADLVELDLANNSALIKYQGMPY